MTPLSDGLLITQLGDYCRWGAISSISAVETEDLNSEDLRLGRVYFYPSSPAQLASSPPQPSPLQLSSA